MTYLLAAETRIGDPDITKAIQFYQQRVTNNWFGDGGFATAAAS
jgi:hypothetical protein